MEVINVRLVDNEELVYPIRHIISKGNAVLVRVDKIINVFKEELIIKRYTKLKQIKNCLSRELPPIEIGVIKKSIKYKGKELKNRYIVLNGETYLESRRKSGYGTIKAQVKEYTSIEAMKKRAIETEIGEDYSNEELLIKAYAIIKDKMEKSEKIIFTEEEKRTGVSRTTLRNIYNYYAIKEAFKQF